MPMGGLRIRNNLRRRPLLQHLQSYDYGRRDSVVSWLLAGSFAPPTVADTKRKFIETYTKPIPSIYGAVVQELLVQQHFIRYNINYNYNDVSGRRPSGWLMVAWMRM